MTNGTTLPHERLIAYQAARELLVLVRAAGISSPRLRDQALDAAGSVCLNIAEATGRSGNADQKRVYAIARGEVCEVGAAMDVAATIGACEAQAADAALTAARRVHSLLCGLIRK
ncbi:MAG TPA: four helix bundle protein [Myxococcales bacterium]|nr:four helix bundle protein [Myxococcales bacterium]